MEFLKLSAIKLDSRFTTSAQMIKLMGHFEVSRVVMRLSDIKRSKMIKRVRLYYCNKELESAVDLKNRPNLWEKAADVEVAKGETEIEIKLMIPIVTCNIILEMADFYETSSAGMSGATELVHCPRCTTAVAPNPGICSNCGENVFQCVKCRAINYDEKEPFLCNSCGFCKYARLESTLFARPLPSVQPIENDNDRITTKAQTVALLRDIEADRCEIGILVTLMEKESWNSEPIMRPNMLLKHITPERFRQFMVDMHFDEGLSLSVLYNKAEQLHKNLINQTKRLAALRAEMFRYDVENGDAELADIPVPTGFYTDSLKLAEVSEEATEKMCQLAFKNQFPAYLLARPILEDNFRFWDTKLRCLMRLAITGNGDGEVDLHTIAVLRKLCSPNLPFIPVIAESDAEVSIVKYLSNADADLLLGNEPTGERQLITNVVDSECSITADVDSDSQTASSPKRTSRLGFCLGQTKELKERSFGGSSAVNFGVLLWLDKLTDVKVELREEYFCLVRTLISIRDIRKVLISQPVDLFEKIFALIRQECEVLESYKKKGLPSNLSFGLSVLQFTELVMCLVSYGANESDASSVLLKYGQALIEELLGVSACFSGMSEYQTRAMAEASTHIASLIMRFAAQRPKQIILAVLKYLKRPNLHRHAQASFLHLLTNIVHPPVKKEESFSIQIEKDPLQEEYLQGRMPGNPYKSTDAGMGPLMRDIKNKICRDCELVALLEDDTGMELLVNQQIIALELPVAEVYDKLWRKDHPEQPMIIIYRMRGLLGDATEPFIKSLADTTDKESINDGQLRLAAIFGELDGLKTIIHLIEDVELTSATKSLLTRMYQLLFYCVKMERNRWQLIESGAISRLLRVFERVHQSGVREEALDAIALHSLELCNILLTDVVAKDQAEKLHSLGGAKFEQMSWLLELSMDPESSLTGPIWDAVTSLVPNLCLGNKESMDALVATFRPCCDWEQIDKDRAFREVMTKKLDTLCSITNAIRASASGAMLKKKLMDAGLVASACEYLAINHPPLFNVSVEGPEWKQFLARPALKYVLKLLAGMARTHKASQEAIAEHTLPILHRLEQISSSEHIGTLAENVMEELRQNEKVSAEIEKVRQETKSKKRQLAMTMRQKQLSKMGMQVGQKGQVKVSSRKIANEPSSSSRVLDVLSECCICREGLDTLDKVMMVYAFASRQDLTTPINGRKFSFTTVSQMNLVHLDCHTTAIRMASGRDEWSSAALHNANTKCNVMIPVWSKTVKDADMANALQRLTNDLEAAVGVGTLTVETVLLDMTQLLDRFVNYRSFSELSQGGGRESNLQFLSVLLLLALHLRSDGNAEMNALPAQMPSLAARICAHLIVDTRSEWIQKRVAVISEIRDALPKWDDAKPSLLLWAIVNHFHTKLVSDSVVDRIQYLRANVANISKQCSEFVNEFDTNIAEASNFETFCETLGISSECMQCGATFD
ncbi:unnamed protein product [Toxocara canis]|uniref:E3_UbLigase_R4 domain-containing protein n=1 Tax=Toxocara canis TaxID=6265 RepID=A0A183UUZ6_TOXCA|nr:unnamed protein product [Toxocara canis]